MEFFVEANIRTFQTYCTVATYILRHASQAKCSTPASCLNFTVWQHVLGLSMSGFFLVATQWSLRDGYATVLLASSTSTAVGAIQAG